METTKQDILKQRARLLARENSRAQVVTDGLQTVRFTLLDEHYAIDAAHVCEVFPVKEITPLPCTPPYIKGIINVRGKILSVLDLRVFLKLPEKEASASNRIIILNNPELEIGVLVGRVIGLQTIPRNHIQPDLPTLGDARGHYLQGITGDRIALLDAEKLLSDPAIFIYEEVDG